MTYAEGVRAAQDAAVEEYVGGLIAEKDAQLAALQDDYDDAVARGEQLDSQVSTLQTQISSLQTQVADLRRQLEACQSQQPAPPDPTPAPAKLLVGATLRGTATNDSTTRTRPKWNIVRTYNNGDALTALSQGKGTLVATSYGSMLGGPGWGSNAATVAALKSQLKALPDVAGIRVGDTHEFDNPSKYGTDFVTYLADAAVFKKTVDEVNATRKNPLIIFRCCMAYSLSQPERKIDEFYTRDPQNYDEFGPDVYKVGDVQLAVDKAKQYKKPLCIPEFGPLSNVAQVDTAASADPKDSILAYMQYAVPIWNNANVRWAAWFDKKGAGADLDQYPKSLAFWSSNVV